MAALFASAVALAVAPALLDASYSWISHTVSESAAQGAEGSWLARGGLFLFGAGVLALCISGRAQWGALAATLHALFALAMIGTAVFSHRPWTADVPYDRSEDVLHSTAATVAGFAFVAGVVAALLFKRALVGRLAAFDIAAAATAVVIPVAMSMLGGVDGLLQRTMFAVAYAWYLGEGWRALIVRGDSKSDGRGARRDEAPRP